MNTRWGVRILGGFFSVGALLMLGQGMAFAAPPDVLGGLGGKDCKSCHKKEIASFGNTEHARIWSADGNPSNRGCASCHGDPAKHLDESDNSKATVISFTKGSTQSVDAQNNQCLTCHKNTPLLSSWKMGAHKRNDVTCASCHSIHGEKNVKSPETCFQCHKEVKGLMSKSSHHPVIEGKVSCSDCHNPHGSMTHGQIKADNVTNLCYKCHADKRGPFVWEHAPVEEDCTICHNPHGSNHDNLLVKRSPRLCMDCHVSGHGTNVSDNSNRFGQPIPYQSAHSTKLFRARGCMSCHSKIHGSNAPAGGKDFLR